MAAKFFAILTNLGAAKLANATALGVKLEISQMAVGDGGGTLPIPNPAQTVLKGEKRRASINLLTIDPANTNQIIAEQVIPENEGGWWIREIGLFDKDGALIAIANCPETYKPQLQEGSGRTQTIRMILIVSSTDAITLKIDPSIVLATRKYVDDAIIEVKAYSDGLIKEHIENDNPHKQYPLVSNALKELADANLVAQAQKNLGLGNGNYVGRLIGAPKVFKSSGIYNPTAGTKYAIVEVQGGGGGGGNATGTQAVSVFGTSGGGGAYAQSFLAITAGTASVVIGAGGISSGNGGTSSFTGFCNTIVALGGVAGMNNLGSGNATLSAHARGGDGGVASGGNVVNAKGGAALPSFILSGIPSGGVGGNSHFSGGALGAGAEGGAGKSAILGAGGSGATVSMANAAYIGGTGGDGVVIIWEYA